MEVIFKKEKWNNTLIKEFPDVWDIYFKYEYFNLFSKNYNVKPESLYWEDSNIKIFWSHLIRNFEYNKNFKNYQIYHDVITPYGYGGPLIVKKVEEKSKINESFKTFFNSYQKYCQKNNYISEFIRFHPFLDNWVEFEGLFEIEYLNDVVSLDLTQDYEIIWSNMSKKTRYYTKRSLKEFEVIKISDNPSENEVNDFISLYYETMDKNEASKKYYFSDEFIKNHFKFGTILIYCKNRANVLASSAMFLKGNRIIHYHLSSSNYKIEGSPSRAVLWAAIEWAKDNGFKWFHLGGGFGSNYSLFNFKKGFSNILLPFYMGKIIFNNEVYKELYSLNPLSNENPNFFPLYRVGDVNIL